VLPLTQVLEERALVDLPPETWLVGRTPARTLPGRRLLRSRCTMRRARSSAVLVIPTITVRSASSRNWNAPRGSNQSAFWPGASRTISTTS